MRDFQRKQKIRRSIYSIPALVLVSIVAFFLARGAIGIMETKHENAQKVKDLQAMAVNLALREERLKEDMRKFQTSEGIKSEIREKFNVTEEGEHVALIVDERNQATSTEDENTPWYKRLWTAIMRP